MYFMTTSWLPVDCISERKILSSQLLFALLPRRLEDWRRLYEETQLLHGKIPLYFLNLALSILCIKPDIEQYLAVTWQDNYSLNVPSQLQTAGSVTYETLHGHRAGYPQSRRRCAGPF